MEVYYDRKSIASDGIICGHLKGMLQLETHSGCAFSVTRENIVDTRIVGNWDNAAIVSSYRLTVDIIYLNLESKVPEDVLAAFWIDVSAIMEE